MSGIEIFLLILIYIFLVAIIVVFKKAVADSKIQNVDGDENEDDQFDLSYRRKYLLTGNELYFYLHLKPVADKLGFVVLSKIRMADLLEPVASSRKEYMSLFARIKAKHIDFVLCDPKNLYVKLLIELDDTSHLREDRQERDKFVDMVYEKTGYKLLHLFGTENIETKITEMLVNDFK